MPVLAGRCWGAEQRGSGCCLLRRWVEEYHVDGFRFDLASALCRDPLGSPMAVPPLIEQCAKDPVLSKVPPLPRQPCAAPTLQACRGMAMDGRDLL